MSYGLLIAFGTTIKSLLIAFRFYSDQFTMSYYNNKIPNDITIVVVQGLNNERLDVLLSKSEFKIPRSHASRLIEAGRVLVNDSPPNKNYKVIYYDVFSILFARSKLKPK